jgi:hypothetical protein
MIVTMTDRSVKSLVRRCEEKMAQGYEFVTKIKKISDRGTSYSQGYGGQWQYGGELLNEKYAVQMRKN